jgi:release factor glutamine methyltransferase
MSENLVGLPGPGTARPRSVYPEREDTLLLLPFARNLRNGAVLDIGTGNGRLALEAARNGARTVATDLNPEALRHLGNRARAERLRIGLVRTDLARGLGRFDRILANPPYLPTVPSQRDPDPRLNLALDGGPDGCRVTARLVASLPEHLAAAGHAFVLGSSVQDPVAMGRIRADWLAWGGSVATAAERLLEGERLWVWDLWVESRGSRP